MAPRTEPKRGPKIIDISPRPAWGTVYLGPATCRSCGRLVWYGKRPSRGRRQTVVMKTAWRDFGGTIHDCRRFQLRVAS